MKLILKSISNRLSFEHLRFYSILFIFGIIICLSSPLNPFSDLTSGVDSSVFLYIGKSMAKYGDIPYKDIFDHKGPLLYLINFLGITIAGPTGVWILELVFMQINIFLIYAMSRNFTDARLTSFFSTILTILPVCVYFQGGNLSEEYALPFIIIALYFFVKHLKFSSREEVPLIKVFIIGFTCGCVLLLRPNMIALWISFCSVITYDLIRNKKYLYLFKVIFIFLAGILIAISPFLMYYGFHSALKQLFYSYLAFNFSYVGNQVSILARIKALQHFWNTTPLNWISFLICVLGSIRFYHLYREKKRGGNEFLLFVSFCLFLSISLLFISMSGKQYNHYGMVLIPCYIMPATIFLDKITKYTIKSLSFNGKIRENYKKFLFSSLVVFSLSIFPIGYGILNIVKTNFSSLDNDLLKIVCYVEEHSGTNQEIIVIGNNCNIYLLTDRKAASKYIYQSPIMEIDESILWNLLRDIETKKPKIIVYAYKYINKKHAKIVDDYLTSLVEEGVYVYNRMTENYWVYERKDKEK